MASSRKRTRNSEDQSDEPAEPSAAATESSMTETSRSRSGNNDRRDIRAVHREVAARRAAHFARPDAPDSGAVEARSASADDTEPRQSWPGPFSTARDMLQRRDEEKRRREEAVGNASHPSEDGDAESPDEYSTMLKAAVTRGNVPKRDLTSGVAMKTNVPSLLDISIKVLADNFEQVACLDGVPPRIRGVIAMELSRRRKLTCEALKLILSEESDSIIVPECSLIDEDTLLECFKQALTSPYNTDQSFSNLRLLELHNCGRCFSDKVAKLLTPNASELDVLILRGCFRVSDGALSSLLRSSTNLRVLDLSCILRLGETSLSAIGSLPHLESLSLDDVGHITDEDIKVLFAHRRDSLKSISMCRLGRLTDASVSHLVYMCPNLTEVLLDGCTLLTDKSISLLRRECKYLVSVDFSNLSKLSMSEIDDFFSASVTGTVRHEFERVVMKNLDAVSDNAVISLCANSSIKLRRLSIAGCRNVTGRAAMAIIKHLYRSLEDLDISFVRHVPEYAILQLIDECKNLKVLHVWGCTQLTRVFANRCLELNLTIQGYFDKYD